MHYRQRIRDAMAAALSSQTAAGTNVFTSRARPVLEIIQQRQAVLSVYTADETSQRSGDGYLLNRQIVLTIEGMLGGGDEVDDALDSLAEEVEAIVDANPTLGNLLSDDLVLESTATEIGSKGNIQVGAFRLDFSASYKTGRQVSGFLPGDEPGVVIPAPPIPSEVRVFSTPTPIAYVQPLDDAVIDGGVPIPVPPVETLTEDITLQPAQPAAPTESVCEDGSCDVPAWQGD